MISWKVLRRRILTAALNNEYTTTTNNNNNNEYDSSVRSLVGGVESSLLLITRTFSHELLNIQESQGNVEVLAVFSMSCGKNQIIATVYF